MSWSTEVEEIKKPEEKRLEDFRIRLAAHNRLTKLVRAVIVNEDDTIVVALFGKAGVVDSMEIFDEDDLDRDECGCSQMPALHPQAIPKMLVHAKKLKRQLLGIVRAGIMIESDEETGTTGWHCGSSGDAPHYIALPFVTFADKQDPYVTQCSSANGTLYSRPYVVVP